MSDPTPRLVRRIRADFGSRADEVVSRLSALPGTSESPERIQAAIVVRSAGNFARFLSELELVETDWRDTLMGSGFEHADNPAQLDRVLGADR